MITGGSYVRNRFLLLVGHEPNHGEYNNAAEHTGTRVHRADDERISETNTNILIGMYQAASFVLLWKLLLSYSLINVIVEFVVTSKGNQRAQAQRVREEYLRHRVYPNLWIFIGTLIKS